MRDRREREREREGERGERLDSKKRNLANIESENN